MSFVALAHPRMVQAHNEDLMRRYRCVREWFAEVAMGQLDDVLRRNLGRQAYRALLREVRR